MSDLFFLLIGLAAVIIGAELVVKHGAGLADRYGIPPILVGMTVVALGTSAPEFAVGISAARQGSPDLAVGNIIGTNLVNVLLVLGLSAAVRAVQFERRTLRVDLPIMTAAALVLYLLARDGQLSSMDGVVLTAIGLVYLAITIVHGLQIVRNGDDPAAVPNDVEPESSEHRSVEAVPKRFLLSSLCLLLLGLLVIVVGSEVLVSGAVGVAAGLGISEAVIGLTIIAIGTSAPELVTTIVSTVRNERSLAIGNLLGSSVFNIALVLGPTVLVAPGAVPVPEAIIRSDLTLLAIVAVACVPAFWSQRRLGRVEGAIFVLAYAAYLTWMITSMG